MLSLSAIQVSSTSCTATNCDFENLYFYEFLSNQALDDKTFTFFYYTYSNGRKTLRLIDSNGNRPYFTDQALPEIDEALFQTWYLHSMDYDLGGTDFIADFDPPISPNITINPDLSFTGFGSCNEFSGVFDFTEYPNDGPMLVPRNFETPGNTCQFHYGFENFYFTHFEYIETLRYQVGENLSTGEAFFSFEKYPGFIFYFLNYPVLSVPDSEKNSFSVYPNPAQAKLFIKSTMDNFSISIKDINGRTVFTSENFNSNEIDISTLTSGMYFINLNSSEGNITKKFLKN